MKKVNAKRRMSELCDITSSKRIFADDYQSEGVPFFRGKEITEKYNGRLEVTTELFIAREKFEKIKIRFGVPQTGDLLLTSVGTLGSTYVVQPSDEFYFKDGNLTWFRAFNGLDSRYLHYWLSSPSGRAELKKCTIGSSQSAYTIVLLKGMEIELPDLFEQRRIASILSAYDDLIENNTRRIAILEELARRIYEEWFIHFRFPGHEGVRMVESELGQVPEDWGVVAASRAVHFNPSTKVQKEGTKPFLAMNCLATDSMLINAWEERPGNSGSKFKNGDTLFARITPCLENGKTGYVQFLENKDATAFGSTEFVVMRSRTLTPEFVYLLARSGPFRDNAIKSMSGASGRQRVKEACFDTYLLAQPNPATLGLFSAIVQPLFGLIQSLAKKNSNLRTTRDLLLPKLISGELDVSAMPKPEAIAA